ncbi:MAG: Spo0E family sporulation regulatory protein-aspartic acid phosphatase [Bacillota bacterium]
MSRTAEEVYAEIEFLKERLNNSTDNNNKFTSKTIKLSKKIDKLLNEYYELLGIEKDAG